MTLTRREFLKRGALAGSGLVLAFTVPALRADAAGPALEDGGAFAPNAYLRIAPDDTVTIAVIRHEMGQGVRTLLPMMLVEELEADPSRIRLEQAVTSPRFQGIELHTSGSDSGRGTFQDMRRAGAAARIMLIGAAAARWGVDAATCRAENGAVIHAASNRRLRFGALANDAAQQPVPESPPLKSPEQFTRIGKPMRRVDGPDIVTGRALYGLDVKVPNLVFASIERAPALGAKLVRFDDRAARARPGVIAVVPVRSGIQNGVAVVATSLWAAMQARPALKIEWTRSPHAGFDSDAFERDVIAALDRATFKVRYENDAPAALAAAAQRHTATYLLPFQAHAPLETMNCLADVRADRAEFWVPTQTQIRTLQQAVKVTGLPEGRIRIHATLMGGGFGRRLFADYLAEAAEISKAIARPVQVSWTREDDTRHGYFQPCTAQRLSGGLDANGKLTAFLQQSTASDLSIYDIHDGRDLYGDVPPAPKQPNAYEGDNGPWGTWDNPYDIPSMKLDTAWVPSPVPHGPWRSVEYPSTVWGRESFLDEMAFLAKQDPLKFRLALLGGGAAPYRIDRARLKRVHELAAERAGWGTPLPQDDRLHGRGIAASVYHAGSYIAQVAEVSVARDLTDLRVHRIVCAVDCGLVLNPLGIQGQTESGITWGLSYTLRGKIDFQNGRAVQRGFGDFTVMRMDEMPRIDLHVVPSTERPGGFGEHPVPMVAPAVGNAVFAATGIRVRRLPITPESLKAAREG